MPGASADAILFMGPMYHIVEYEERLRAIRECSRLLKPGGKLFTAAITRYATILWATTPRLGDIVFTVATSFVSRTPVRGNTSSKDR